MELPRRKREVEAKFKPATEAKFQRCLRAVNGGKFSIADFRFSNYGGHRNVGRGLMKKVESTRGFFLSFSIVRKGFCCILLHLNGKAKQHLKP